MSKSGSVCKMILPMIIGLTCVQGEGRKWLRKRNWPQEAYPQHLHTELDGIIPTGSIRKMLFGHPYLQFNICGTLFSGSFKGCNAVFKSKCSRD